MNVIFLAGYPGSGKGTQGKKLSQILGIPHISTGELFRSEAKTGSKIGNKMKEYMDKGQIIPNDFHFGYLHSKLEVLTSGYILDGYPKNMECLDFILEEINERCEPVVIYLDISRSTAVERLSSRLFCEKCELSFPKTDTLCNKCSGSLVIRHDDKVEVIQKRLDVFEESTRPLFERYKQMGIFRTIDGEQSQERVSIDILLTLFPYAAYANVPSVFHNHIDAKNKDLVEQINQKITEKMGEKGCKYKIYSVEHLFLCSQVNQMSTIYDQLPNFHQIQNSTEEAFSTCKMGTKFNYSQEIATLDTAFGYPKQGVMTEIEEELIMYDLSNTLTFTLIRHCDDTIDWSKFGQYVDKNIVKSKLFELHHGFELPKTDSEMPISLDALSQITSDYEFKNGGWFIFKNDTKWLYRSNEFSEESYTDCLLRLMKQSTQLQLFLSVYCGTEITISSSLERVHGIWPIDKRIFVNTSNLYKLKEYQDYLSDYVVINTDFEIREPDSDSITIIRYKASQLPVGYITDDVSLDVEGVKIGTDIKWNVHCLGHHTGKKAIFNCFIGVKTSDNKIKIYKSSVSGKLVKQVGDGFGFGPYFLPDGAEQTLGQFMDEKYNARYLALQDYLNDRPYSVEEPLIEWTDKFQKY